MKTFTFTKLSVGEIELSSSERPRELVNFVTFSIFFFYFSNRVWLSLYEQALSGNDMQFFILPEIINWQYLSFSPFSRTHHLEAFLLNTSSLRSRRTKGRGYGRRKRIWAKKTEGRGVRAPSPLPLLHCCFLFDFSSSSRTHTNLYTCYAG